MARMSREEIQKACEITYSNALQKCLVGKELVVYMFVKGMVFQATGEMPKDSFEELLNSIKEE